MTRGGDPWSWSVDEVVDALCSHDGLLRNSTLTKANYDLEGLKSILRDNQINGLELLLDCDARCLKEDLGIKALGQRTGILRTIDALRDSSIGYNQYLAEQKERDDKRTENSVNKKTQPDTEELGTPGTVPKQSADSIQAQLTTLTREVQALSRLAVAPASDGALQNETSPPIIQDLGPKLREASPASSVDSLILRDVTPEAQDYAKTDLSIGTNIRMERSEQPVLDSTGKKRRKVAPMLVSEPRLQESYLAAKAVTVDDALNIKTSIIHGHECRQLDDEDGPSRLEPQELFVIRGQHKASPGHSQYLNKFLKSYLRQHRGQREASNSTSRGPRRGSGPGLKSQRSLASSIASALQAKPQESTGNDEGWDAYLNGLERKYAVKNGGENDRLLPTYGDSDSESLDSETWNEIQQGLEEDGPKTKFLSGEQIDEIIREYRQELEDKWIASKKPRFEAKAHRLWTLSRVKGTRGFQVKKLESRITYLETRMAKIVEEIKKDRYTKASDVKQMSLALEMTITDMCEIGWEIGVLNSPTQPPKIDKPVVPKKVHKEPAKDIGTDEEVLTDTDQESDMGDFIEPDTPDIDFGAGNEDIAQDLEDEDQEVSQVLFQEHGNGASPNDQPSLDVTGENDDMVFVEDVPMDVSNQSAEEEDQSSLDAIENEADGVPTSEVDEETVSEPDEVLEHEDPVRSIDSVNGQLVEDDIEEQAAAPQTSPAHSHIIDLTMSDDNEEVSSATPITPLEGPQIKIENSTQPAASQKPPTSTPSSSSRPVWKEPPRAPASRSPVLRHSNIVSLQSDDEESELEEENEEEADDRTGRAEEDQDDTSEGASDKAMNLVDELSEKSRPEDYPEYGDIEELLKLRPRDLEEDGDRRKILAFLVAQKADHRQKVSVISKGLNSIQVSLDVWRALDLIKSHGTKKAAEMPGFSVGFCIMAAWFVSWVTKSIPHKEKGLKLPQIITAIGAETEFEVFYDFLQELLLLQAESRTDRKVPQTPTLKRQRLLLSDEEEASELTAPSSWKKKRKFAVKESQEAKTTRANATQRALNFDWRKKQLQGSMPSISASGSSPMINLGKSDDEEPILMNLFVGSNLFPYQVSGVQFMWREIVSSEELQGCLLAQPMGMGKTVQVIATLVTIAEAGKSLNPRIRDQVPERLRVPFFLILCPSSLVENWDDEMLKWIPNRKQSVGEVYRVDSRLHREERIHVINEEWAKTGGILLMSYPIFRVIARSKSKVKNGTTMTEEDIEKAQAELENDPTRKILLETPNLVVCDEAQEMKGNVSQLGLAVKKIKTTSRIAMTGSPLSNNLEEYYRIIDWVAPNYLGDAVEFRSKFVEPISAGLYIDATTYEKRKGLKMLSVFKSDIAPKVHRDELSALSGKLRGKTEFVIRVSLTDKQDECYRLYVHSILQGEDEASRARIWAWLSILRLLCNHPYCFERKIAEKAEPVSEQAGETSSDQPSSQVERMEATAEAEAGEPEKILDDNMLQRQLKLLKFEQEGQLLEIALSHKMQLLFQILKLAIACKERVLVFSHSIPTLNYVERKIKNAKYRYIRIDGVGKVNERQQMTKDFNDPEGSYELALISTRAGGTGLNLFGASRVVILDDTFNPMHEQQAIGRAFRIGQKRHVFVYRIVLGGTFEEQMQNQAIFKIGLSSRVVDKKDTIRQASKGLREWIYTPKEVEQEDIAKHIGNDKHILDRILQDQDAQGYIRSIKLADSFLSEEREDLTEEEQRDVRDEQELLRLKRLGDTAGASQLWSEIEARAKGTQQAAFAAPNAAQFGSLGPLPAFQATQPAPPSNTAPLRPSYSIDSSLLPGLRPLVPPSNSDPSAVPHFAGRPLASVSSNRIAYSSVERTARQSFPMEDDMQKMLKQAVKPTPPIPNPHSIPGTNASRVASLLVSSPSEASSQGDRERDSPANKMEHISHSLREESRTKYWNAFAKRIETLKKRGSFNTPVPKSLVGKLAHHLETLAFEDFHPSRHRPEKSVERYQRSIQRVMERFMYDDQQLSTELSKLDVAEVPRSSVAAYDGSAEMPLVLSDDEGRDNESEEMVRKHLQSLITPVSNQHRDSAPQDITGSRQGSAQQKGKESSEKVRQSTTHLDTGLEHYHSLQGLLKREADRASTRSGQSRQ